LRHAPETHFLPPLGTRVCGMPRRLTFCLRWAHEFASCPGDSVLTSAGHIILPLISHFTTEEHFIRLPGTKQAEFTMIFRKKDHGGTRFFKFRGTKFHCTTEEPAFSNFRGTIESLKGVLVCGMPRKLRFNLCWAHEFASYPGNSVLTSAGHTSLRRAPETRF